MGDSRGLLKDAVMDNLVKRGVNIASFVSFGPDGHQRFCRIRGVPQEHVFDIEKAIATLLACGRQDHGPGFNINIRSFLPEKPDGNPFFLGTKCGFDDPKVAVRKAGELIRQGYYVIVNENIDPADGGFSGVALGDTVEFAACDVPRCVDKVEALPCAVLSRALTRRLVREVFGFNLVFPFPSTWRIEFSVHPGPAGYFHEKLVIWQAEEMPASAACAPAPVWPNRFSSFMGDKAFGLLMADLHDFPVPLTKVFGRVIPPFSFGKEVHSGEGEWIRTCPRVQEPGRYTTKRGYLDPFALMHGEDPDGTHIASIIMQQGIKPGYSGAVITGGDGKAIIEGKAGRGDSFMTGDAAPAAQLPPDVLSAVTALWCELGRVFGTVRFEWVFDNYRKEPWIIQLHGGASPSVGNVIYPLGPKPVVTWYDFRVPGDLEALRALSAKAKREGAGIRLVGNVGITSHPADILRRDKVPSMLSREL